MINIPSILVWLGPTLLFNEIGLFSFYFSMFVKTAFISTLLSVGCKGWSPLYKAWIKGLCLHAMSLQSCLTLCDPMDCSPPGTSSMEFSRQEYWNGLPCPPPGDLPNPGIEPMSLMSPALTGGCRRKVQETASATWELPSCWSTYLLCASHPARCASLQVRKVRLREAKKITEGQTRLSGSESVSCSVVSNSLRTPWTVARQAPLSIGLSRQEYWSGLLFLSPADLPDPGMKASLLNCRQILLLSEPPGKPEVEERGFICTEAYVLASASGVKNSLHPNDAPADTQTGQSASNQGKSVLQESNCRLSLDVYLWISSLAQYFSFIWKVFCFIHWHVPCE